MGMVSVTSTRGGRSDYVGGTLQTGGKVKAAKFKEQQRRQGSGMSFSLAFTPVQGIELVNPRLGEDKESTTGDRYFGGS